MPTHQVDPGTEASPELREFLERTGNLLIHLLDRCNLECRHCYLGASPRGEQLLPVELVLRTLAEAHELGIQSVQFSGGEPLLYPGIFDVLRSTHTKRFAVTLSTNAVLVDEEVAARLAAAGARVVTSIDGPATHHDGFRRRKGAFARAEVGIAHLVDAGVPVHVVMTVSADSQRHVDWCAEWALETGVETLQFQPLQRTGRGGEIADRCLTDDALNDLYLHLNDLSVACAPRGLKIRMTYRSRDFMLLHPCTAFVCNGKACHRRVEKELKKIVVREDGTILPELVDIDRRFAIGNLHRATLESCLLAYLEDGYERFDRLCRAVFQDTVPDHPSPLIPWNEILAERSRTFELDGLSTKERASYAQHRQVRAPRL